MFVKHKIWCLETILSAYSLWWCPWRGIHVECSKIHLCHLVELVHQGRHNSRLAALQQVLHVVYSLFVREMQHKPLLHLRMTPKIKTVITDYFYIVLSPILQQTHCALAVCDSKGATSFSYLSGESTELFGANVGCMCVQL